jgi:hypothetical protein
MSNIPRWRKHCQPCRWFSPGPSRLSDLSWSFSDGFFKQYLGQWAFGHRLVIRWNDSYSTLPLLLARAPMLLLTPVLGWVLYILMAPNWEPGLAALL